MIDDTLTLYKRFHEETNDPVAASNLTLAHAMLTHRAREEVLTVIEAARRLKVSDKKVYELCRTGQLTHSRVDGQIRIRSESIDRFIQRSSNETETRRRL